MRFKGTKMVYSVFVPLLFLPGCVKHSLFRKSQVHTLVHQEDRVRLSDIPIAIDGWQIEETQGTSKSGKQGAVVLVYYSGATFEQLMRLYLNEMIYHGWRVYQEFDSPSQRMIVFEKPLKKAIVTIIDQDYCRKITISTVMTPQEYL